MAGTFLHILVLINANLLRLRSRNFLLKLRKLAPCPLIDLGFSNLELSLSVLKVEEWAREFAGSFAGGGKDTLAWCRITPSNLIGSGSRKRHNTVVRNTHL